MLENLCLTVNVGKTVCMLFTQEKKVKLPTILLNNQVLKFVPTFKYLDVILSNDLNSACNGPDINYNNTVFWENFGAYTGAFILPTALH